jgi:hypothetical protein
MRTGRPKLPLSMTPDQRCALEGWSGRRKTAQARAMPPTGARGL